MGPQPTIQDALERVEEVLAVVTAAAMMQAAGGIDWMVAVAAKVIQKHPKQITLIAPLTARLKRSYDILRRWDYDVPPSRAYEPPRFR